MSPQPNVFPMALRRDSPVIGSNSENGYAQYEMHVYAGNSDPFHYLPIIAIVLSIFLWLNT